jgi:DNA-binding NarL/FixJ family response regulator
METVERKHTVNVLLVGNNPIELSNILSKVKESHNSVMAEIAFDLRSLLQRLVDFAPNHIVIDDNIGKEELSQALTELTSNKKTREIPITVLKNSNYEEAIPAGGVWDYLLKQNLSAESFVVSLRNSLKFRRTQLYLYKAYKNRKMHLQSLMSTTNG